MKTKSIIFIILLVTIIMLPIEIIAQSSRNPKLEDFTKVDPAWRDFVDGTLKGHDSKPSNGGSRQQMPAQPKSNNKITNKFLGCTFRVTTMEEAVRILSNNYQGQVGDRDILIYDVKFADNMFPFSQFTFNNDKLCTVNFISVYTNQKQALSRRASLKKQLSKKYNLVERVIGKYKCYFAGDDSNRMVALVVQEVDEDKSETGKAYYVYLQYVDIKQADAANDDL